MHKLISFFIEEDGATAIEYGMIAAMIGVAILTSMSLTGSEVIKTYDNIGAEVGKALK